MNKRLTAKELLIIGICLIILAGLTGNLGSAGRSVSALLLVGGFICIVATPFNIKKRDSKKDVSKDSKTSASRDWKDLE
jgi:hypothetical protein